MMNVSEALHAIATTGEGCCWYCDRRLPRAGDEAVDDGWDVQRIPGERVASIILVCPACLREKEELGEEAFLQHLSMRVCNSTCYSVAAANCVRRGGDHRSPLQKRP